MKKVAVVKNMEWPPTNFTRWKMAEHSAWYSGDPNILANFYNMSLASNITGLPHLVDRDRFWARQVSNNIELGLHVPIAGDICSTSADLLFNEAPSVKIIEAHKEGASASSKAAQETLDDMLDVSGFYRKIIEGAETCSAMGGTFLKIAWDKELSPFPIVVVEQADTALAEFKFGHLIKVSFWETFQKDDNVYFRLFEIYSKDGSIDYKLYKGTLDRLGEEVGLNTIDETKDLEPVFTQVNDILCAFIPNVLPNRYNRSSWFGRSDFAGIEGLMDSLDETYSSWMKDILLAQAKIMVPMSFLDKVDGGNFKYNADKMIYAKMDMDPTVDGDKITPVQFKIRADEFEKTSLSLLERIISSAGYSPQSFGLNIEGRAESGTALSIRERKSMATKRKKEAYWDYAIKKIVKLMILIYKMELQGKIDASDLSIGVQFSDSFTNDVSEVAEAVSKLAQAEALSTETKVRMTHPDWAEDEVRAEVKRILDEKTPVLTEPDNLGIDDDEEDEEPEEGDDE